MISDKTQRWAEAVFKKEERDRDGGSRFCISSETILPKAAAESASRYPWLKAAGIFGQ
jgi:hypothetical protein